MNADAVAEIRLCHAAARVESCLADDQSRRVNAEALQRALMRHADAIVRALEDHDADRGAIEKLATALTPFARVAEILSPGQNPVLLSLPAATETGRTFVQLRPADFRRAAAALREVRS